MPRRKGQRGEVNGDWEASRTEENDSGANSSNNRVGDDEFGNENENGLVMDTNSGVRPHRNKLVAASQTRHNYDLGQWTEAVTEFVGSMEATHKTIKNLQDRFTSHKEDLEKMDQTRESLKHLDKQCKLKDEEIKGQLSAINALSSLNAKNDEDIRRKMENIEKQKQEIQHQKEKSEKRITAKLAEEESKLRNEFEKLALNKDQSYSKRKKELEDEYTGLRNENNKQVTALSAEKMQLSTTVEEQRKTIEVQAKKLDDAVEACDDLKRAKDSVKKEMREFEVELEAMKKEFALISKSKDYFTRKFSDINRMVVDISWTYFREADEKDFEKIHKQLAERDSRFESIPIDDTDDSLSLRAAYAQQVISEALCEYIWKPFCSEYTSSHPELNDLLTKMADELEKSGQGGRAANVWRALTMRALQSLPVELELSRSSEMKESHGLTDSRRTDSSIANAVAFKVFSHFSALIQPSQTENLHAALLNLTVLAIVIWNDAQAGDLRILVHSKLDLAHREEWRSTDFDPAPPSGDYKDNPIISQTRPRIFTLFPRLIAREVADLNKDSAGPPGSWPLDSDPGSRIIETCIHHGIGLLESSPLIVRGQEEQERKKEFVSKAIEDAYKDIHVNRRHKPHGERSSVGSSTSVPTSPSEQWKMGRVMKFTEK